MATELTEEVENVSDDEEEDEEDVNTTGNILDIGQSDELWLSRMKNFASAKRYQDRVNDFARWLCEHDVDHVESNAKLVVHLIKYFDEKKDCGKYSGTTFKSWFSMFESFCSSPTAVN
jgi:hypothetical protein